MCSNFGQLIYLQLRSICFCNAPFFTTRSIHSLVRQRREKLVNLKPLHTFFEERKICMYNVYVLSIYVSMYTQYSIHTNISPFYIKNQISIKLKCCGKSQIKSFFVTKCPRVGYKLYSELVMRLLWYIQIFRLYLIKTEIILPSSSMRHVHYAYAAHVSF